MSTPRTHNTTSEHEPLPTTDHPSMHAWPPTPDELLAADIHQTTIPLENMPAGLRDRLYQSVSRPLPQQSREAAVASPRWPWIALAAALALLAGGLFLRSRAASGEVTQLAQRLKENQALLDEARRTLETTTADAKALRQREVDLAQQLASASAREARLQSSLDDATLRIATLEAPTDPVQLAANRTKLLDVPGTIRVGWKPFDVAGLPEPEQPALSGDVVWNDELQTGYLRFVGLKPNDPATEQYQVWVIDERGLEQKVSGGVFNASAEGEIIVPIHPGIDVGRVSLFAITVEQPGGTWVPDLKRRLVIAPRDS